MKIFIIAMLLAINVSGFADDAQISLSSHELYQGGVIYVRIHEKEGEGPILKWLEKEVCLLHRPDKKIFEGFIAADLLQDPGPYDLDLVMSPSGVTISKKIKVVSRDYGVRRLSLPSGQVDLSPENQERVIKEKAVIDQLWKGPDTPAAFNACFIMPLESEVISPFGRRSIINNQPRSPHTGVDLRGKTGTPVKASNKGRVVFTGDQFFAGNSVIIDHGAGIFSMYFHLDKINVSTGSIISKGEILGTVGSTGRSTGPHLHWGMRVNNMRVDPVSFVKISTHMEE